MPLFFLPWIAEPFTQAKWIALYFCAGLAGLYVTLQRKLVICNPASALLGITVAFYLVSLIANYHSLNTLFLLRALASMALILFYGQFFSSQAWPQKMLLVLLACGSLGVFHEDLFRCGISYLDLPMDLFGNLNMSSEYYGYFALVCLFLGYHSGNKLYKLWSTVGALNALALISVHQTRSVFVALFSSILFFFFFQFYRKMSRKTLTVVCMAAILIGLLAIPSLNLIDSPILNRFNFAANNRKTVSTRVRWIMWNNTLELIKDNPLGVGFQEFGFSYMNYRHKIMADPEAGENMIPFSPHNTFLDIASEYGIGFSLLLFFMGGVIFFKSTLRLIREDDLNGILFSCSSLVYFFVLSLFAFPLENAWSYSLVLFCLVHLVCQSYPMRSVDITRPKAILLGLLTFAIITLAICFTITKYVERHASKDLELSQTMCSIFPSEWRVCLNAAQTLVFDTKFDSASTELTKILVRQPHNFIAEKLLAYTLFKLNNSVEACKYVIKYDSYFENGHSLTAARRDLCK